MINDAVVTISNNGVSYKLASRDSGWYQDTSKRLVIASGQTYRLDIFAESRHAWAETTVPVPVGGLTVSRETLYTQWGCIPPDSLSNIIIKWTNPSHSYLYYKFICDSDQPYCGCGNYISWDSVEISDTTTQFCVPHWWQILDTVMPVIKFRVFGTSVRYKMLLYSTTPDYLAMVIRDADSTHKDFWNNSPTNIHGGLGYFTSFGIDSVSFNIVPCGDGNDTSSDSTIDGGGGK